MPVVSLIPDWPSGGKVHGTGDLLLVLVLVLVSGCNGSVDGKPGDASSETETDLLDGDPVPDPPGDGDDVLVDAGDVSEDPSGEEGAVTCDCPPPFGAVGHFETVIAASEDPADVYHPDPPDLADGGYAFPVALFLQGAEVGRHHYQLFATAVASHGFVVVVPDHETISMAGPGLYAEQEEIQDVLVHMRDQFADVSSPLHGVLDLNTLLLLGHSYGGVAGLNAIRDVCEMPSCVGFWSRPAELRGGAFWGTNLAVPMVGTVPDIENDGLPVALVQGTLDSMATPADGLATYEKIMDPPRIYAEVVGANHYGICNVNNPPGADADESVPTLEQATSIQSIARVSALFLRAHVLGDGEAVECLHACGENLDAVTRMVQQSY